MTTAMRLGNQCINCNHVAYSTRQALTQCPACFSFQMRSWLSRPGETMTLRLAKRLDDGGLVILRADITNLRWEQSSGEPVPTDHALNFEWLFTVEQAINEQGRLRAWIFEAGNEPGVGGGHQT